MGDYDVSKAAARVNRAFYRAFEELDIEAMSSVWLDDPGVKCVHPGWHLLVGYEQVIDSWRSIFESSGTVRFELADLDLRVYGAAACATLVERIRFDDDDGGERRAEAAATNLFAQRDGEWKLVVHHASPIARPPVESD